MSKFLYITSLKYTQIPYCDFEHEKKYVEKSEIIEWFRVFVVYSNNDDIKNIINKVNNDTTCPWSFLHLCFISPKHICFMFSNYEDAQISILKYGGVPNITV